MAQANSSAQREPSMEEILASIRRIIEDNDSSATPEGKDVAAQSDDSPADHDTTTESVAHDLASGPGEPANAEAAEAPVTGVLQAADHDDASLEDDVRSFRKEFSADSDDDETADHEPETNAATADDTGKNEPGPNSDAQINALSMADIQAEVAKQTNSNETAIDALEVVMPDIAPDVQTDAIEETAVEAPTAQSGEKDNRFAKVISAVTAVGDEVAAQQPANAHMPIISEEVGRKVAAAFGELSEAFSHTKKFDNMAEEMMRPMLQDWLDNNLPVLVERLVREEIDRVARGAD